MIARIVTLTFHINTENNLKKIFFLSNRPKTLSKKLV